MDAELKNSYITEYKNRNEKFGNNWDLKFLEHFKSGCILPT